MAVTKRFGAAFLAGCLAASAAPGDEPMSAIDWLSQSIVGTEVMVAMPVPQPQGPVPDTSGLPLRGPGVGMITVAPISGPTLDALGILPSSTTGLPRNLWGTTPTAELARLIRIERIDTLPAVQSLLYALLMAELDPPIDADGNGTLYLARVDKLLDLGALEPAMALLETADAPRPEPFRRWFDVALLLGLEQRACATMIATPEVAPTFPARIFCLAREGDWTAAALSLRTGEALGYIEPEMAALLGRFLDPDLSEGEPDLPLPQRPSPLVLTMMEAIGQPLPTSNLPLAFAYSDLRSNTGWKTQIEAGERLARSGAIEPNKLLGLYTEQRRSASGGVWERVDAIQRLDKAIAARDPNAVALALGPAWDEMQRAELEVAFAALYGKALSELPLTGDASALALRVGLLSEDYEKIAAARKPIDGIEAFMLGLARGDVSALSPPDQLGGAIKRAFAAGAKPGDDLAALLRDNRRGEALLIAIAKVTDGAKGDLRDVTEGLIVLRSLGLETTVRRAALELMLLERRG